MTTDRVREVVATHGRLAVDVGTLLDDDDLYRAGMTSHASVSVMLALDTSGALTLGGTVSVALQPPSRAPSTTSDAPSP